METANQGGDRPEAFEERIRILHLEDDPSDPAYVAEVLSEADLSCEFLYAEDRQSFERVLAEETAVLIISDFAVPGYDGLSALKMTQGLDRPIPFILFSGTIGEEAAIESLRLGATDYVLKQRPDRLVTAVRRALQEAGERKARHRVEAELRRRETLLRQILESIEDMIMVRCGRASCAQQRFMCEELWRKGG